VAKRSRLSSSSATDDKPYRSELRAVLLRDRAGAGSGKVGVRISGTCTDRLRWQGDDLKGELAVMCGIIGGRAVDGSLSRSTFNFSSQRARDEHAKFLTRRARTNQLPWLDWLEELCERTIRAMREGLPGCLLRDVPLPGPDRLNQINGWPLPADDATVTFGDAETGKSILGMYVAGTLSAQGIPTLYVDFEWNAGPHRSRLGGLFPDALPPVHYVRCDRPLVHEADRLRHYVLQHGIRFGVFDSVGYACAGKPEDAEHALAYFRAGRPMNIGSLHLAHVTKPPRTEGGRREPAENLRPFGSTFWHASARSTWFVQRTDPDTTGPDAPLTLGLYHRKSNSGPRHPAIGFQFTFSAARIHVARVDLADVDDLGARLPLWQRMRALLKTGALPVSEIAESLQVQEATVRQALKRDADRAGRRGTVSMFTRVDGHLIGLLARRAS
jgi:hypothetical protein